MFNPFRKPGFLIRRLHQVAARLFQEAGGEFDLTPLQYVALQVIDDRPGIDQISLSQATDIDRTTIIRIVRSLETDGRIRKACGDLDRRTNALFVTKKGAQLLKEFYEHAEATQTKLLEPLSPHERQQFMNIMTRLVLAHAGVDSSVLHLVERAAVDKTRGGVSLPHPKSGK
jgi:MarR family transcriptional regulator, lower aerobic nicotinate degradation pathway regulator